MQYRANVADDDEEPNTLEVSGVSIGYSPKELQETDFDDPFLAKAEDLLKIENLNANFKRNVSRKLQKAYTGQDDAKSKKLDPLDLTGYSLFQIVQPPYNVMYLAQLYDISPYHHAAIDAKVSNTVGLGYKFEETQKLLDKLEDVSTDEQALERLRRKVSRARVLMKDKVETLNSDDSFEDILRETASYYRTLSVPPLQQ